MRKIFLIWIIAALAAAGGVRLGWAGNGQQDQLSLVSCDNIPAPFDCGWNEIYGLEGSTCPKGDIPYGTEFCNLDLTNWLTLYSSVETEYSYEYRTTPPSLCPTLPQFWGPSSNGTLVIEPSGCPAPPEAKNCSITQGGLYASKWCYLYKLYVSQGHGTGCDVQTVPIAMRTVDLVGNNGACDASDLAGFASLIGTHCCTLSDPTCVYTGGPKYNPIADYNKDGVISGSDLALFAAHFGHHCGQWAPSPPHKPTMADYPWEVLDRPDMQAAMAKAGVDRQFIITVWFQNGPEQRLFARPSAAAREAIVAAMLKQTQPAAVEHQTWGKIKILYR